MLARSFDADLLAGWAAVAANLLLGTNLANLWAPLGRTPVKWAGQSTSDFRQLSRQACKSGAAEPIAVNRPLGVFIREQL